MIDIFGTRSLRYLVNQRTLRSDITTTHKAKDTNEAFDRPRNNVSYSDRLLGPTDRAAAPTGPIGGATSDEVGPAFLANQDRLSSFTGWLNSRKEFEDAGFIAPVFDPSQLSLRLLWKGKSPLQIAAAKEAARRGLNLSIEQRPYGMGELRAAGHKLDAASEQVKALGFNVAGFSALREDSSTVILEGEAVADRQGSVPSVDFLEREMSNIMQVAVQIRLGVTPNSNLAVTRQTDTSPYNAGGFMRSPSFNVICSSGFAVRLNTIGFTTTARHCGASDYQAYDLSSSKYGGTNEHAHGGQARVLTREGWGRAFDGAYNNSSGFSKGVDGLQDVGLNSIVCTSGGNSGVHCNIKVVDMAYANNDGFGTELNILGTMQSSGQVAAAGGDSGGPVMISHSTTKVGAVGMIQFGRTEAPCPALRTAAKCFRQVGFTSMRTITNNLGGQIMTQ